MSFHTLEVSVCFTTSYSVSAGEAASDCFDASGLAVESELEIFQNQRDLTATEKGTRSFMATVYIRAAVRQASYTQS
jgi:hypothetical protein